MTARTSFTRTLIFLSCLFLLSACKGLIPGPVRSGSAGDEPFRPPTLAAPSPTPAALLSQESSQPTPTPPCENNLVFLEDKTIPDGTVVEPGATMDKEWLVQNKGTCNWNEHYQLRLIEGEDLGAAGDQALFPARSGTQAVLRIQFTAPQDPGMYTSAWQAYDPAGNPFGDPFYIQIEVKTP